MIEAQAMTFVENLNLFKSFSFIFRGGYDSNFTTRSGYTSIHGVVTLSGAGSVTMDKVIIK